MTSRILLVAGVVASLADGYRTSRGVVLRRIGREAARTLPSHPVPGKVELGAVPRAQKAEARRVHRASRVRADPRQRDERRYPCPDDGEWISVGVADEGHPVDVGQRRVI